MIIPVFSVNDPSPLVAGRPGLNDFLIPDVFVPEPGGFTHFRTINFRLVFLVEADFLATGSLALVPMGEYVYLADPPYDNVLADPTTGWFKIIPGVRLAIGHNAGAFTKHSVPATVPAGTVGASYDIEFANLTPSSELQRMRREQDHDVPGH